MDRAISEQQVLVYPGENPEGCLGVEAGGSKVSTPRPGMSETLSISFRGFEGFGETNRLAVISFPTEKLKIKEDALPRG